MVSARRYIDNDMDTSGRRNVPDRALPAYVPTARDAGRDRAAAERARHFLANPLAHRVPRPAVPKPSAPADEVAPGCALPFLGPISR